MYYKVAAVNRMFEDCELSESIAVRIPGPPQTVFGVSAAATSSTSIDISWNKSSGATAYRVYYEAGSSNTRYTAGTVGGTNFIHTGLTPDTDYRYFILAIDNSTQLVYEGYLSSYVSCTTPVSSTSMEPIMLILTNKTSYPLKSIQINNSENKISTDLYTNTDCQIKLASGSYTISVYDTQDKYLSFPVTIENSNVSRIILDSDWPSCLLTLRNNYSYAVAMAYLQKGNTGNWGNNLLNNAITTNNSQSLGNFEQGIYSVLAESQEYYRVTSGVQENGMIISGGVLDGYRPVYYKVPDFILNRNITVTAPASGWITTRP